jgi:hypothetical protein
LCYNACSKDVKRLCFFNCSFLCNALHQIVNNKCKASLQS